MPRTLAKLQTGIVGAPSSETSPVDARLERSKPDTRRFLQLLVQLALVLGTFRVFRVEQFLDRDSGFFLLSSIAFGAFTVHYWLPFRLKEPFWVAVSVLSIFVLLDVRVALGLLGAGFAFYLVLSSRLSFKVRALLVTAIFGLAIMGCHYAGPLNTLLRQLWIPGSFWPIFSSLFIFRMISYVQDVRYMKERPPLREYLAYFFILPNYYFPWFPVIDYKTMRISYYRRNIHEVAQQGIAWIFRGTLHLLLYRVVYHYKEVQRLEGIHSPVSLVWYMLLTFLLYLRISGQFHIIIGLMHLFGYDLPETNHKYLLSRSLTDFWRRINIYWKDFMVRIFYFPVYFQLRKKGELRAQVAATSVVFIATWALHAYQTFWLRGSLLITWQDIVFWGILGMLVVANVWWEHRHLKRSKPAANWRARLHTAVSVTATLLLIITLWSFWNAPTLKSWVDLMIWWKPDA